MFSLKFSFFRRLNVLPATAPLIVRRLDQNPIVRPEMLPGDDGSNICGPSLIRVPDWAPAPLGRYYLYFAHHNGTYIRLAFADRLEGPWKIHRPGSLKLSEARACRGHIASPDVHVDDQRKQFRMYFHGVWREGRNIQRSFAAISADGIRFTAAGNPLANFYLRAVPWEGGWIGMAKGGVMYRSYDGLTHFERLPRAAFPLKDENANRRGEVRHVALHVSGATLFVYYTRTGDAPESVLRSQIDLGGASKNWRARNAKMVVRPETIYEGVDLPVTRSEAGPATGREHALRDPAIFVEDGRLYICYAVAGESGIAIAELVPAFQ